LHVNNSRKENSPKSQLFYDRLEIATINSQNGNNPFWTFIANLVASLNLGGMSEDETGDEGTRKYVIRAMNWRSEKLIPYLNIVDIGKRPKNVFGKMPSGNAP